MVTTCKRHEPIIMGNGESEDSSYFSIFKVQIIKENGTHQLQEMVISGRHARGLYNRICNI